MSLKAQKKEQEKNSMLARFEEAKRQELQDKTLDERPWDPNEVTSTIIAEKWRKEVLVEIAEHITRIVDERLSESQIRDKNDEINVLVKEKEQWEIRIRELGGPDYTKSGVKTIDFQGSEVPGNKGYKYYGRAKDLPGVRELLAKADGNEIPMVRSRRDFYKFVDADYYGYRDEEDGRVLEYEQQYQKREYDAVMAGFASTEPAEIRSYVDIPTLAQVEEYLVDQRRRKLLDTYVPKN